VTEGGTNYILHVYQRRIDQADRGISTGLKLNSNLTYGSWTNDTSLYTLEGAVNVDDTWRSITNRINADAAARFIRVDATLAE
jgi:hypothetical protein